MEPIVLPDMTPKQEASWRGILAVSKIVRSDWCLVGGQMVQLWCWERGTEPNRPTDDGDAVLDIRAQPRIMKKFTQALVDSGFEPDGQTWEGHQHRWTDGAGQVDILLPEGIGPRADRKGVRGGTTLETPGAQNVLDRAEAVEVSLDGEVFTIFRPTLQGALLAKAFAYGVTNDPLRRRHLEDLAALAALIRVSDHVGEGFAKRENTKLFMAYSAAIADPTASTAPGAAEGFARLKQAVWPNLDPGHGSLPASDGGALVVIRLVFGSAMAASIVLAVHAIPRQDFVRHSAWMTRGYALGVAAGTQSLIMIVPSIILGDLDPVTKAVLMAASWVINLAVAEYVIRRRAAPQRGPRP